MGFEEISIFLKERAYGQVGILGHAAVVAFAAAAFTGKHGTGALDVLMELQVLVDGKGVGHRLHVEIVGADECNRPALLTQNVDNLHERAGSTEVIHLHGELSKVCSMDNRTTCVKEYPLTTPIKVGDKAEDGSQLRPYIVMFGEYIDSMNVAIDIVSMADIFVVVGTSLKVYPAAGFINYAHHEVPKFVIDPGEMEQCTQLGFTHFKTTATEGMKMLLEAFKEL